MGLAPLAGDVSSPLGAIKYLTSGVYDFEGLRRYKAKLLPDSWHPISLSFPPEQGPLISLIDALGAFAPEGFLPFGLRSLFRRRGLPSWLGGNMDPVTPTDRQPESVPSPGAPGTP